MKKHKKKQKHFLFEKPQVFESNMTKERNFKICLIGNKENRIDIANVKNKEIEISETGIYSVNKFNEQVCDYIVNDDIWGIKQEPPVIISEDIIGVLVDTLRWRRATAYLWIQKSYRGYRYLCYMSDEIKHSAECFGTDVDHVIENQLYKIKDLFTKAELEEKYIKDYPELLEAITSMNNIEKVNEHFGI